MGLLNSAAILTYHLIEYGFIKALLPHRLSFETLITIPSIQLSEEAQDFNLDFAQEDYVSYRKLKLHNYELKYHYLLGHPFPIQYYVEWDCASFSKGLYSPLSEEQKLHLKGEMKNWKLLFQIDSDNDLEVMWGDFGILYICLHKDDLAFKRFENAWTIMQCS